MRRATGHVWSLSTAWRAGYASHQQSAANKVAVLDNLRDSQYKICLRRIIGIPISYLTSACGYVSWSNAAYSSTAAVEHTQADRQQQATGSADAESHKASIGSIEMNGSSNSGGVGSSDSNVIGTQHHINQISIDELLHNKPLAAAQSSAAANSSSSSSSSSSSKVKSQQELTEQLMSELFDAELEQRLLSAAAAARHTATTTTSSSTTADTIPLEDTEETVSGFAPTQTYQQQQQQRSQHQPGVTPAPAYAAPSSSSSSSSSSPSRIASWHPASSSSSPGDSWAPLPGPAAARRQLANQLQHLLKQAGVSAELAAAAVTAAAAAAASDQQQQRYRGNRQNITPAAAAAVVDYVKVFSRLRTQQLVHLLDDCQAPTYGSKGLLVHRMVLLLREQYTLQQHQQQQQQQQQGVGPPGTDPSKQHVLFDTWLEGEAGFVDSSSSSSSTTEAENAPKKHQRQMRDTRIQQVAAAAAARQQLLDNVLDVGEIGGWLLAARAQDVCIVDVRGRAGLHEQLVIASGVSQRHAHACAEAVAWQIREKAQQHVQQQQQQQQEEDLRSSLSNLLPMLKVLGDLGADWAVLDTGKVVIHVLTERARRFYDLEGLWGGAHGRFIRWLELEQVAETKDTIGRDIRG